MAGQRTRIRFGSVSAEVLLEKTSTKPKAAQHETRRVLVEPSPLNAEALAAGRVEPEHEGGAVPATDPFGDPVDVSAAPMTDTEARILNAAADAAVSPLPSGLLGPMGDPTWPPPHAREPVAPGDVPDEVREAYAEPQRQPVEPTLDERTQALVTAHGLSRERAERVARGLETLDGDILALTHEEARHEPGGDLFRPDVPESAPDDRSGPLGVTSQEYVPPATKVEQGVHLEDGTWVDLTDRLTEVDRRTRVDGLEVVRTIPASSYASERVREAHYLCGVDPDTFKVLALLWRALRLESKAAEVRWTKRTAQAAGIIVARGELPTAERPKPAVPAHLLLLELEWAAQIKRVPPRARGPIMADVAVDEVVAAVELVQSFAAPAPREELRDERLAKRAELLELARAGKLAEYVPPAEPMPEDLVDGLDVELAEAMALAASWNREHAPA